ncbi:MAG: SnoaL-like domain-containing protein [Acidobacteria bacterium]|nr:SnoaL-like domain-containing protein [Acidobacteriota bacterium]
MSGYTIVNGIAEISDPEIYSNWLDNEEFKAAVAADPSPERSATKRLLIEFEADLARIVRDNRVQEDVVKIMTKYVREDYIQRDPNTPGNGRDMLIENFRRVPIGGQTPPPVVSVILDGDIACVMMRLLEPDPVVQGATYEWNILTVFRVQDGKLAEHWSTFRKVAPGQNPMGE